MAGYCIICDEFISMLLCITVFSVKQNMHILWTRNPKCIGYHMEPSMVYCNYFSEYDTNIYYCFEADQTEIS